MINLKGRGGFTIFEILWIVAMIGLIALIALTPHFMIWMTNQIFTKEALNLFFGGPLTLWKAIFLILLPIPPTLFAGCFMAILGMIVEALKK